MAKPVAKLFDDPAQARAALEALQAQGYASETGLVMRDLAPLRRLAAEWLTAAVTAEVPEVGTIVASGPASTVASDANVAGRLAQLLGVPAEAFSYYESGLRRGGVLVVVQAEGDRRQAAHSILQAAGAQDQPRDAGANSPGFVNADRATETNQADLRLSGDFRKY